MKKVRILLADRNIGCGVSSEKVTLLSIVAAMMVVAIHVGGNVAAHGSLVWWWEQIGHYGLFLAAVPFFFICSGFFLGRHCDEDGWWWRECLKRMRTLLVPYLIWSAVFAALGISAAVAANLIHGRDLLLHCPCGWRYWTRVIGVYPFNYPCLVSLWYIRSLLIFVVLSPLLVRLVKSGGGIHCFRLYRGFCLFDCTFARERTRVCE